MSTRRALAATLLVALLLSWAGPVAPVGAQDLDNPQCRTIVGCADAGPKPEHPGDRGGYAQFLVLGVLVVGVGFIGWKLAHAVREGDAARAAAAPGDTDG